MKQVCTYHSVGFCIFICGYGCAVSSHIFISPFLFLRQTVFLNIIPIDRELCRECNINHTEGFVMEGFHLCVKGSADIPFQV